MLAAESTQFSQAVTLGAIGAFVTVLTIVLNSRTKRHADAAVVAAAAAATKAANDAKAEAESVRLAEKAADLAADIAKEARDYARQDLVAQRADERAETLLISSRAALQTTQQVVAMTRRNSEKLDVVEHLGNSNLTQQHESRLVTLRMSLTLAKEVAELQRAMNREPTAATTATIAATEKDIDELEQMIVARKVTDAQAVAMLAQPSIDREAADLQIEAAATQQHAADKQQKAADQISTAMAPMPPPPPPPPP